MPRTLVLRVSTVHMHSIFKIFAEVSVVIGVRLVSARNGRRWTVTIQRICVCRWNGRFTVLLVIELVLLEHRANHILASVTIGTVGVRRHLLLELLLFLLISSFFLGFGHESLPLLLLSHLEYLKMTLRLI